MRRDAGHKVERYQQTLARESRRPLNYYAYGYRRMWKALLRAGEPVGRDRVKRLMQATGLQGAKRRGKPWRTARRRPRRPTLD
jgi:hypothetical protein